MFTFIRSEDGAVTIDWVVLTAAIVGLGIALLATVSAAPGRIAATTATELGTISAADDSVTN